ncbi:MAG: threonine/serine exporter family protein [Christensenellaceae bacterium]
MNDTKEQPLPLPQEEAAVIGQLAQAKQAAQPEQPAQPTAPSEAYSPDRILSLALDVAEKLLEKGAQIQRVEDSIVKICLAYGAQQVEPYAITSLIEATIRMPDGTHTTQLRRVYETTSDLKRLGELASLVDRIVEEKPPIEEAESVFEEIVRFRPANLWRDFIGMALGAGSFAVFFGGSLLDGLAAALIGIVLALLNRYLIGKVINAVARTAINSLVSGLLSVLVCRIGPGQNLDAVMMGTIMLFITGILLGNALRDLLCGDLMAGTHKVIQAFITAATIAAGYSLAFLIGGALL